MAVWSVSGCRDAAWYSGVPKPMYGWCWIKLFVLGAFVSFIFAAANYGADNRSK